MQPSCVRMWQTEHTVTWQTDPACSVHRLHASLLPPFITSLLQHNNSNLWRAYFHKDKPSYQNMAACLLSVLLRRDTGTLQHYTTVCNMHVMLSEWPCDCCVITAVVYQISVCLYCLIRVHSNSHRVTGSLYIFHAHKK